MAWIALTRAVTKRVVTLQSDTIEEMWSSDDGKYTVVRFVSGTVHSYIEAMDTVVELSDPGMEIPGG